MKINKRILNPIIMRLLLVLMGNVVCISNLGVIITRISSRRVKISI